MNNNKFGLGAVESPVDMRDYTYDMLSKADNEEIIIPEKFILDYKFPILDQGNVGSCVAHVLSCMKSFIDDVEINNMYSVGFIYANREEDDYQGSGLIVRQALANLVEDGDCFNSDFNINEEYPEILSTLEARGKAQLFEKAKLNKSLAYVTLTVEDIKDYLVRFQKPILVVVRVYRNFYESIYNGGVIPKKPRGSFSGNHAMMIVGFDNDDLVIVNSWGQENGDNGRFYLDINSSIIRELWVLEDRKKVRAPEVKKYKIGWNKNSEGKWTYSKDGETLVQNEWAFVDGKQYYLDGDGIMHTGWLKDGSCKWCYLDIDKGYAYCGRWVYINSKWYMFDEQCCMKTGWVDYNGKKYYLEETENNHQGKMYCNGTFVIDGREYTFDEDGALVD